jgi:DNA polymerase III alpha subunit (gram-positive type)
MQTEPSDFDESGDEYDLTIGLTSHWQAMESNFVILDLKVAGADPVTAEVIEFAALLANGSCQIQKEFSALIKTEQPVPAWILEEPGLSQEEIDSQGVDLVDACTAP